MGNHSFYVEFVLMIDFKAVLIIRMRTKPNPKTLSFNLIAQPSSHVLNAYVIYRVYFTLFLDEIRLSLLRLLGGPLIYDTVETLQL